MALTWNLKWRKERPVGQRLPNREKCLKWNNWTRNACLNHCESLQVLGVFKGRYINLAANLELPYASINLPYSNLPIKNEVLTPSNEKVSGQGQFAIQPLMQRSDCKILLTQPTLASLGSKVSFPSQSFVKFQLPLDFGDPNFFLNVKKEFLKVRS